ncbi:hypothetical protein GCAAIG_06865 [Candidatus Electronema halotolerans]
MRLPWLKPKDYENLKLLGEALKNISERFGRDVFNLITLKSRDAACQLLLMLQPADHQQRVRG